MTHACTAFCGYDVHVTGPLYSLTKKGRLWETGQHVCWHSQTISPGCIQVVGWMPAPEAPPPTADFEWDDVRLLQFRRVPRCSRRDIVAGGLQCPAME